MNNQKIKKYTPKETIIGNKKEQLNLLLEIKVISAEIILYKGKEFKKKPKELIDIIKKEKSKNNRTNNFLENYNDYIKSKLGKQTNH